MKDRTVRFIQNSDTINSIYWSDENLREVINQELNAPGVCVWG